MAKPRKIRMNWKQLGFIPSGCDESSMIKYGDEGFLYLCNELRNDYRKVANFTIRDRKWRPGQPSGNGSTDWSGFYEAIDKPGAKIGPPDIFVKLVPRVLSKEERDELGKTAHANWVAVMAERRRCGQAVSDAELRRWDDLSDEERELFRRGAESLAQPEYATWDALTRWRQMVGEKVFRKKMFEVSVSAAFERMTPNWTTAEKYQATAVVVKLSEMLDIPVAEDAL
jgi:hypothetical protein